MTVTPSGDLTVVRACGELDIETAPQLHAALCEVEARDRLVELDLRELTFMDSCGIRVVMQHVNRARRDGFRVAVIPPPAYVARALELTGVMQLLPLIDAPTSETRGTPSG
jgi:anti-anti-sigma factor